ncbi:ATP-grasp domain-containing protein [bacterium]|nr:ATP-grasp domain-containing protein [bacterium]
MKKILLFGGSAQQIVAIETAKRLGYYTVLCDYLPDNPGQYHADKFYLVSTTDKEAVLEVAKSEKVDGVLAYASDPAAPTAAYVAEKLGLPGNPYDSVEILCNKDRFRKFLAENGFCTPKAKGYDDPRSALNDIEKNFFNMPVIIKPVDSSGSKGATVLHSCENSEKALEFAFSFSRCKRVVVEEFIEKKHPYLVGGDIFVQDGRVVIWGLMNCHRDQNVNPLVPVGKSFPPELEDEDLERAKSVLQNMVDRLHIGFGAMNIELVVDGKGDVFLIDVGPRSGGNMIPDLLGYIFGIDVVEMTVQTAMGEMPNMTVNEPVLYYATHNLHASRNGIFNKIRYSEQIRHYIVRECLYKKPGDHVEYFDNAAKALGIVFFKFDNAENMAKILGNINEHIIIEYKN